MNYSKKNYWLDNPAPQDHVFIMQPNKIWLVDNTIPQWQQLATPTTTKPFYCFAEAEQTRYLLAEDFNIDHAALREMGLRQTFELLPEQHWHLACLAHHIQYWRRTHQFCGNCGTRNQAKQDECAMECPACGHVAFPRLSPSIIVLIYREGELLLARGPHFAPGVYSTTAGFVEMGETIEQTVHREIFEELGITVSDVEYVGSQPWPFPDSLMLGFTAKYSSGEINIDKTEIEDAKWFALDNLPTLSGRQSISRYLIERHLKGHRVT